jgi:hypothetical protein
MLKIAFGMIVFEGDYVLKECLECIYPHAAQILIAEGPVLYWQQQGRTTSTDRTNEILANFPDPDHKIIVTHGQYSEKDEQCQAYMKDMRDDIDYIWEVDSDELYRSQDIEKMISILEKEQYTSVGMRSCSFYGGFNRVIGGFEEKKDNFMRIFKVCPGCYWQTHRPPTISYPPDSNIVSKHLDSDTLYYEHGIQMYHYSYVFPRQVSNKIAYYKAKVSRDNCIDNYISQVYVPWMRATNDEERFLIEKRFNGVHEFKPTIRPHTFTKACDTHPFVIIDNMKTLNERTNREFEELFGGK